MFPTLGNDARLSPLLPGHAAELAACVDSAREHLRRWTVVAARVIDVDSARLLLECYVEPPRYFGIWRGNVLVGGALFRTFDVVNHTCELGGWLTFDGQGQGLITQAFRHMVRWAAETHGMCRVELRASPENFRALAIAERLGMTYDATLREAFTLNGQVHDSEVWAFTRASGLSSG